MCFSLLLPVVNVGAQVATSPPDKVFDVLLLIPGNGGHLASNRIAQAIEETLLGEAGSRIKVEPANVDFRDLADSRLHKIQMEWFHDRYAGQQFDLVIVITESLLPVASELRDELWPNAPILTCGADKGFFAAHPMRLATGVFSNVNWREDIELAKQLLPRTRHVALIGGASRFDHLVNDPAAEVVRQQTPAMDFIDLSGLPIEGQIVRATKLPPDSVILFGAFLEDIRGNFNTSAPGAWQTKLARDANSPMFVRIDSNFLLGGLGGYLVGPEALGRQTGHVAWSIVTGKTPPNAAPIVVNTPAPTLNWQEIQRWKIPSSRIPKDAIIAFVPLSLWATHKDAARIAIIALVAQTLLIVFLMLEQRRRQASQKLLAERLRFETLLAQVSSEFAHVNNNHLEPAIQNCLSAMCEFFGSSTASIWEPQEEGKVFQRTHAWPVDPRGSRINRLSADQNESAIHLLLQGKEVFFSNEAERAKIPDGGSFRRFGIRSFLALPLHDNEQVIGFLSLANLDRETKWAHDIVQRLRVIADILGSALTRRRASNALFESEQKFRHLFEETPIGIALEDLSGKILLANPALCSMLGYTLEEMTGMNCSEFTDAVDEDEDWKHFQELQDGIRTGYRIEKRYSRKNGAKVWGNLNVSMLKGYGAPLILATVEDISEKKAAAEKLTRAHSELQELTLRLFASQEEEKQRIARELHDDFGQRLSLLNLELDLLKREMPADMLTEHQKIHSVLDHVDELTTDVHNMSHQLHSSKLRLLGLRAALKDVCEQVAKQYKVAVQLHSEELPYRLSEDASLVLYRVAQEALQNAVKHSRSQRVEVRLMNGGPVLCLCIQDFGVGFESGDRISGLGLVAMQERLRIIGGRLRIESSPGAGTQVTAEVDIDHSVASIKETYSPLGGSGI